MTPASATPAALQRAVAYLVNVYPAPSHSFIRREITALESAGWQVHRFSHRASNIPGMDPADEAEQRLTCVLRAARGWSMLADVCKAVAARPRSALSAFALALRMAWRGDRRFVAHLGYFVLACLLWRRLLHLGCRHVHAHFGTNPAAVALLAHRLGGLSYSLTFHGPHEFVQPDRLNIADKIAEAAFVVVISLRGEHLMRQRHPEHAAKLRLIHCGLDALWFSRRPLPVPQAKALVSVARLDPQKNPLMLIEAAGLLARRGERFQLTIIGDGSLRAHAERCIQALGLAGCVRLLGWGTQAQVRRHLSRSRALVLASQDEGLPVAIMEAFACGRPAIATHVGGVHELVEPGVTGWLVQPGDVAGLAEAMHLALSATTPHLQQLADQACQKVAAFDVRHSARQLGVAFDTALAGSTARAEVGRPPPTSGGAAPMSGPPLPLSGL